MEGFPFDSRVIFDEHGTPTYDRAVSSMPLRKLIGELFTTGVMPNPSDNLQVFAGTDGMTVIVHPGFAVVNGGLCKEDEDRELIVTAADSTYDRIDTVVVRWNENVDVRTADLYILQGTPAAIPVRPTLTQTESIYEIGLADIFITRQVATITADKITDTRMESARCGIVSSISQFDTTTLYNQIQGDLNYFKSVEEADFLAWIETIKDILDEETAGHLQLEIDDINAEIDVITAVNTFNITTTDWVSNTNTRNNETYTVMQEITTHAFDNTSADATLDGFIISATSGEVMTTAEEEDSNKICKDCVKSANGFYVYATEATTTELRLRVKGV